MVANPPTNTYGRRQVVVIGADGVSLAVSTDGSVKTIPYLHQTIHEGELLSVSGEAALAAAGTYEFLVQTNGVPVHLVWEVTASLEADFQIFEGPTFSAAGTAVTPVNHNRGSANTLDATITHTPTTSVDGVELYSGHMASGSKQGGAQAGLHEFILTTTEDYLIRFTSLVNNNTVGWQLYFYEGEVFV